MKNLIIISLVVVFLMPAHLVAGQFAELSITRLEYDPFPAEAGEYVDVFIKVQNTGLSTASNVACELRPAYPFSLDPDEPTLQEIGTLPPFKEALFDYRVRIAADAVEGDNVLELACGVNGINGDVFVKEMTVNVESTSPFFAIGEVRTNPEDMIADIDDLELIVEVQNVGEGEAKLVVVELGLPTGFQASTSYGTIENLGSVQKDSSKEATFQIDTDEDLAAGVYEGMLVIQFKDDNNNDDEYRTQILPFAFQVQPAARFVVDEVRAGINTQSDVFTGYVTLDGEETSPSLLAQGDTGELRVRITNDGEEDAESVSVKVFEDTTNTPIDFDEIFDFIGTLDAGESGDAVFTFTIDNDAVLKDYFLDIEIRYVNGDVVQTSTETLRLPITTERSDPTPIIVVIIVVVVAGAVVWKKKR